MGRARRFAGGLFVALGIVLLASLGVLQLTVGTPGLAGAALSDVAVGGLVVRAAWYGVFAAAVALIPASVGLALISRGASSTISALAAVFGVLAGFALALAALGWTVLVPWLSHSYTAPESTEAARALALAIFDAANAYLGTGVGQHLGALLLAAFTLLAGVLLQHVPALKWAGVALAAVLVIGMLGAFGVPGAALVGAYGPMAWGLWAGGLGVWLLRAPRRVTVRNARAITVTPGAEAKRRQTGSGKRRAPDAAR